MHVVDLKFGLTFACFFWGFPAVLIFHFGINAHLFLSTVQTLKLEMVFILPSLTSAMYMSKLYNFVV